MLYNKLYEMVKKSPTKWVALSGLIAEIIEERHARLRLPLADMHLNHIGTAYAGSMFMIGEISAAMLFFATYGLDKYIPVVQKINMSFKKPCKTDLIVDIKLSKQEAENLISPIIENNRGPVNLVIPILNTENIEVAEMDVGFYILPVENK